MQQIRKPRLGGVTTAGVAEPENRRMEIAADDLRLEGRKPWTNACPHPAEAHRWRYLPVFDYLSGQLVCTRCGQALAGAASTY